MVIPESNRLPMRGTFLTVRLTDSVTHDGLNIYQVRYDYNHHDGTRVPAGFVTNLATVPRWLRWYVTPASLREAAVVHDFYCGELGYIKRGTRLDADKRLLRDMRKMGFGAFRRSVIYLGVRLHARIKGLK